MPITLPAWRSTRGRRISWNDSFLPSSGFARPRDGLVSREIVEWKRRMRLGATRRRARSAVRGVENGSAASFFSALRRASRGTGSS